MEIPKLFLDANVFFSAVKSHQGGSAKIFELAKAEAINLCSSSLALYEARKNIVNKLSPQKLPRYYLLVEYGIYLCNINKEKAQIKYKKIINSKDAPILASAIKSKSDFLITLDRKHFFNPKITKVNLPIKILTPGDFLQKYL